MVGPSGAQRGRVTGLGSQSEFVVALGLAPSCPDPRSGLFHLAISFFDALKISSSSSNII